MVTSLSPSTPLCLGQVHTLKEEKERSVSQVQELESSLADLRSQMGEQGCKGSGSRAGARAVGMAWEWGAFKHTVAKGLGLCQEMQVLSSLRATVSPSAEGDVPLPGVGKRRQEWPSYGYERSLGSQG